MIEGVVLFFGILHCAVFVFLTFRFEKLKAPGLTNSEHCFSVIIPVRNESDNIKKLLDSIDDLDYPSDKFEVLIIDDSSIDGTGDRVREGNWKFNLNVYPLPDGNIGKKSAIELGIQQSKYELIVTTDGDCVVSKGWLQGFNRSFGMDTQMVVGPVKMKAHNFFGAIQSFDFSMLVGYAAALVGLGIPSTSNGANLAYRKSIFEKVDGYNGNKSNPSGDDEFLLLKVFNRHPRGIVFLKDQQAVVETGAIEKMKSLLNQRVRWMSKWRAHGDFKIIISVLLTLIDNLVMIGLMIAVLIAAVSPILLYVLLLRAVAKGLFSCRVNRILKGKTQGLVVIIYEIFYPFYVLLLSLASIFGNYSWKGRHYD